LRFGGRSLIAGPDARALVSAGPQPEAILIAALPEPGNYNTGLLSTQARDFRAP
jgi:hypothetical protein